MELLEKELTEKVIGACFEVANDLGNGFLDFAARSSEIFMPTSLLMTGLSWN